MSLLDKLKKNSTIKSTQILADSDFFNARDVVSTRVPALNIALSGSWKGGFLPGLTIFAAESKHFKSNFSLIMVSAYLQKYPDAVCLFYDSEFGITPEYLSSMGVDPNRLIHVPITNIEELKFDIVAQLENIARGDHVIVLVDSIGNLASKKELEDAKDQKSVADMSRAKSLKSLFRIVTPYLASKDIPMVVVNHVYSDQGCLTGDTLVRMGDNTLKPIKDIVVGDIVISDDGSKQSVIQTYNSSELYDKPELFGMYRIEVEKGVIECTGNHKFLTTSGKWVEARNLTVEDELELL